MAKPKIFISHVSEEAELAQLLKQHVTRDFLKVPDVFVSSDMKSLAAGGKWLDEVTAALKDARVEIVLCSKRSVSRPWVHFEAGAAWIRDIPIIPFCHSGMEPELLPVPLNLLSGVVGDRPEAIQYVYERIASALEMERPSAHFAAIAKEVERAEERLAAATDALDRVSNPRLLCGASAAYGSNPSIRFELDVGVLRKAFGAGVVVEPELTPLRLGELLTTSHFDVVHLVVPIDPGSGDLFFGAFDGTGAPLAGTAADRMNATGFRALVEATGARLVVLATCDALEFATKIASITNVIATRRVILGEDAAEWEQWFYGQLASSKPLFKAYEVTEANSDTPFLLHRHRDVVFVR